MPKAHPGSSFYAVAKGHSPGVYDNWADAEQQVKGFNGAKFKKFKTKEEAKNFITAVQSGKEPAVAAAKISAAASSSSSNKGRSGMNLSNPGPSKINQVPALSASCRQVYCDGACAGNGKPNAIAGSGVFWNDPTQNIAERVPGKLQTNQRAELYAILRVLESDKDKAEPLEILTDSAYSIACLQDWHHKWAKNNWHTSSNKPVVNADLIQRILYLIRARPASGKLKFTHVRGHRGIWGNEEADKLAVEGSKLPARQERDYAGDTAEDELWAQVGDLPLGNDMLEFDIDTQAKEQVAVEG